jgi:hypothetical protein
VLACGEDTDLEKPAGWAWSPTPAVPTGSKFQFHFPHRFENHCKS